MEEKNVPAAVASEAVASKAVASKAVASKAIATVEAATVPVKATVPASDVAAGASADAARGQISPADWDPYEEVEYIRPANPYDTSLVDPWKEELSSDVGSDDESRDTKAHQVLRRLESGQYDCYFAKEVYMCPFCTMRSLGATDFNCFLRHAENISSCRHRVGSSVNVNTHYAKHKALGIHLCKLQEVAIAAGRMAPIKRKAPGILGWQKQERRYLAEARWQERSEARKRAEAEARDREEAEA